jgi:hypothetical protein
MRVIVGDSKAAVCHILTTSTSSGYMNSERDILKFFLIFVLMFNRIFMLY